MNVDLTEQELVRLAIENDNNIKVLMKTFKLEYEQAIYIAMTIKNMKEKVWKSK